MDERPGVRQADPLEPLPLKAGQPARYADADERTGGCNRLRLFPPLAGWRQSSVPARRASADFADWLRDLVAGPFPELICIRMGLDNLRTPTFAALSAPFPPAEARRIARKLELHYTPKQGSWLNRVEIELGVRVKPCLNRRIPDVDSLRREVTAWQMTRNDQCATVQWRFKVTDARTRLTHFYP